jgi:hypothetical protein
MTTQKESPLRRALRGSTIIFLVATVTLTVAASLVGIADNPPGILLLYGAGLTLVLAVTHRWRSPNKFGLLFFGAVLGFFFMVVLHNFAEVGADRTSHLPVLAFLLSAVSIVGFISAIIVCPVAGAVGAFGWMAMFDRQKRRDA